MRTSSALLFALKAVLAAVTLGLLVRFVEVDAMGTVLAHARLELAWVALALVPVSVGLEVYRWWRLVRRVSPDVRYRDALVAVLGGYPLGLLTPGRVGEYVGRAALLTEVPAGHAAALTFADKMATLAAVLVGGLVALGHYLGTVVEPSPLWPSVVFATTLATGVLLLAILFPSGARAALGTVLPFAPVRRAVASFDAIPQHEAALLLALSFVRYLVFSGQFVLMVLALAPGTSPFAAAAGVALVYFAKSAVHSITLGDLGIREGAAVFFLGAYGVPEAAALEASLGVFAINLLLPALVGVPLLLRIRLRARSASALAP
ncbi:MAG: lysylphosphatidylglycerol synthase transmembrane domain-containing protein [Bacteroidota bacterium]